MRIAATITLSLLASAAGAEPDPQIDRGLSPAESAAPYGVVTGAPTATSSLRPRLKLDTTLSSTGPTRDAHGLQPSDAIVAPAEAAAFEAEESIEPAGPATHE